MPWAGFEPEIPMFKQPKIVLALDRSAIETGIYFEYLYFIIIWTLIIN
jgi:hypothetical protein